ncbi:hypothetical protein KFK09_005232 [Dendrobium nobile]|uniref:Uncharacterized protein n=1 Tax=Dendrobium nobile TaxID=94219 RepID=A0A8T3BVA9_DENNO|nr:hypothetical protein KFK09_005232 [Dendrobium nobile]
MNEDLGFCGMTKTCVFFSFPAFCDFLDSQAWYRFMGDETQWNSFVFSAREPGIAVEVMGP